VKKEIKSRRTKPGKQANQPPQGYFIFFPPRRNLWFDMMTAEERREIDDFEFSFEDPALLKKQMTKWRKAWNRIYRRVGYRPRYETIYDDGLTRLTAFFPC
jgi:hypothetical protein